MVACGVVAGLSRANAQGTASSWEHGIFRYVWRLEIDSEKRVTSYRWIVASEEEREEDMGAIWSRIGVEGAPRNDESDHVRVLDQLSSRGWELVNRSDAAVSGSGATAVTVSYVLRRPK
jgi:hypothetical protein